MAVSARPGVGRSFGRCWCGTKAHGVDYEAIAAVREGRGASRGVAEPTREDFVSRMEDELAVSLAELQRRTEEYDTHP